MNRELERQIKECIKERDEALLSLDKDKILAYMHHWDITPPKNELVFWGGIHKARLASTGIPPEEKEKSRVWLKAHGFRDEF